MEIHCIQFKIFPDTPFTQWAGVTISIRFYMEQDSYIMVTSLECISPLRANANLVPRLTHAKYVLFGTGKRVSLGTRLGQCIEVNMM